MCAHEVLTDRSAGDPAASRRRVALPDFLIIGAMKAGTSSVCEYLRQHPQIYMSPIKEPNYFSFGDQDLQFRGHRLDLTTRVDDMDGYRRLFDGVTNERAIGEGSTSYLLSERAVERIRECLPEVRLIAILRNPVERAFSQFLMNRMLDREPIADFEAALRAEPERAKAGWAPDWQYRLPGFYHEQLSRYHAVFPEERIRVFLEEDLKNDPVALVRDICEFLGVDGSFAPDVSRRYMVSRVIGNRWLRSFVMRPNRVKSALKRLLPRRLRQSLRELLMSFTASRPRMTAGARRILHETYREDILKLQDLIGRDLSAWLAEDGDGAAVETESGGARAPETRTARRILENRQVLDDLLGLAREHLGRQDPVSAAVLAQMAASFAWFHHPGIFRSDPLEELLLEIGRREVAPPAGPTRGDDELPTGDVVASPDGSPRRVLHVITQACEAGGHTRFLWRWIHGDEARQHSVVLTAQGKLDVPAALRQAVSGKGGVIEHLELQSRDPLARARALRAHADDADFIVLHIYPFDVIPMLAFADRRDLPPIAFLNHADHVFWLGVRIADLFVHFRESGRLHSVRRRSIPASATAILPIPLADGERQQPLEVAKEELGLPPTATVLLSVAWGYKYTPIDEHDFLATHSELLKEFPEALLLVIGARRDRRWRRAAAITKGRIRALGVRPDVDLYYEAADILVDSFPFGSHTSLLDAAAHQVPVVSLNPRAGEAALFRPDDPSLSPPMFQPAGEEEYKTLLRWLMSDRDFRRQTGRILAHQVRADHTGEGWRRWLEAIYEKGARLQGERAGTQTGEPPDGRSSEETGVSEESGGTELVDSLVLELHRRAGMAPGAHSSFIVHGNLLPLRTRTDLFLRSLLHGRPFSVFQLLKDYATRLFRRPPGGR